MVATNGITDKHRLLITLAAMTVLAVGVLGIATMTTPSAGQSTVALDTLQVADANETVDGNVSDVTIEADVAYEYEIPDAEQRVISLYAGPNEDSLERLTFDLAREDIPGTDSGTVSLGASLFEHADFDAATVSPALAESETTEFVVAVELEVERANGETETKRMTEQATLTLTDENTLQLSVGGAVEITVTE